MNIQAQRIPDLGVSKEKLLHRHPPGGNSVIFGVLKFLNAYEENWNWDPNNSALWSTNKAGIPSLHLT